MNKEIKKVEKVEIIDDVKPKMKKTISKKVKKTKQKVKTKVKGKPKRVIKKLTTKQPTKQELINKLKETIKKNVPVIAGGGAGGGGGAPPPHTGFGEISKPVITMSQQPSNISNIQQQQQEQELYKIKEELSQKRIRRTQKQIAAGLTLDEIKAGKTIEQKLEENRLKAEKEQPKQEQLKQEIKVEEQEKEIEKVKKKAGRPKRNEQWSLPPPPPPAPLSSIVPPPSAIRQLFTEEVNSDEEPEIPSYSPELAAKLKDAGFENKPLDKSLSTPSYFRGGNVQIIEGEAVETPQQSQQSFMQTPIESSFDLSSPSIQGQMENIGLAGNIGPSVNVQPEQEDKQENIIVVKDANGIYKKVKKVKK
jgi:hypothetical protein